MEDQVIEQSAVNPDMNSSESPETSVSAAPESQENGSNSAEETSFDAKSLGSMDENDQFEALKAAGVLGDEPATKNANNEVAEANRGEADAEQANEHSAEGSQQEELLDVVVDGKTIKMSKSELIAGYQRQADYTRKTQELAAERRRYDALIAQAQAQQTEQPTSKPTNTAEAVQQGYESAVKMAAKKLGIDPEDFNQFDSVHQYALQQAILTQNAQKQAVEHRNSYASSLIDQARQDPMCDSVMSNLDTAIGQMYCNPQTTEAAKFLSGAKDRFFAGQASMEDIQAIEGLYNHVRSCIINQSAATKTTKPAAEPPATEGPGAGNAAPKVRMDKRTLRSKHGDDQFAYLKRLGVFN